MIDIRLPDGRTITIDTDDPQAAAAAGRTVWAREQAPESAPAPAAGQSPALGVGGADIEDPLRREAAPSPLANMIRSTGRNLTFGAQKTARGLSDLAMMVPDLAAEATVNIPIKAANLVSRAVTGEPLTNYQLPLPSQKVADLGFDLAQKAGLPVVADEDQSFAQKALGNILEFGTQGLAGGAGLARVAAKRAGDAAPRLFDSFIRPYLERPKTAIAGDTVAGAGAGTALTASQSMPEGVREQGGGAVGAGADLLSMLLGGVAGGTAATTAANGPRALVQSVKERLPAREPVPFSPEREAYTNRDANRTAKFLQDKAVDAPTAAENIQRAAGEYRAEGLPMPSSGLISGDTGVENVERAMRLKEPTPFMEIDRKLHTAARDEVAGVGPANANPRDFTDTVEGIAQRRIEDARGDVDRAQTYSDRVAGVREQDAAGLSSYSGPRQQAAATAIDRNVVDQGYLPARAEKNRQFNEAPGAAQQLPADDVIAAARTVRQQINELGPERLQMPAEFVQRLERLAPDIQPQETRILGPDGRPLTMDVNVGGTGTALGQDLADIRMPLRMAHENAEKAGNFTLARNINTLRTAINRTIEEAPGYAEANTNYAQFADTYRPGRGDEMAKFTRDLDRDTTRTSTPPSQTASLFIQEGQPEKAAALRRGIDASANPREGVTASGEYLLGEVADAPGVIRNGRVDGEAVRRWLNRNNDVLESFPEIRTEINNLGARAQRGEISAQRFAEELNAAKGRLRSTEDEVYRGPFRLVTGRNPENAVRDIFGSGDPERNMAAIRSQLGGNRAAEDALKRATADYLYHKITDIRPAAVESGNESISFSRLTKMIRDNERTLVAAGFTPDEMNAMRRAQKLLEPLTKKAGQATTGSPTAENQELSWRLFEVGAKMWYGGLKGGNVVRNAKLVAKTVLGTKPDPAAALAFQAMTNPELAAHLLTRDIPKAATPAWNAKLAKLLRRTEAARELFREDDDGDQTGPLKITVTPKRTDE